MRISIDGGALCSAANRRYGTYSFTSDFLNALSSYDKQNTYYLYSFCNIPKSLRIHRSIMYCKINPKTAWMSIRVPFEEFNKKPDIFLALNQALPLYTKSSIFAFSHGTSFIRMPKYYHYDRFKMQRQLKAMVNRAKIIFVSSLSVKKDIKEVYPKHRAKLQVLPFGIPEEFMSYTQVNRKSYFLFVGMNHRIKNVPYIIEAFEEFRSDSRFSNFTLKLVGPFANLKNIPPGVVLHEPMEREKLVGLYRQAAGYLTASYYESFNYPVLEALSQQCPVIGTSPSIIPEMKEYCSVAKNQDEFVGKMIQAALGKSKTIDLAKLHSDFSWKKYINKMKDLYSSL